jgi:rubrerythrin
MLAARAAGNESVASKFEAICFAEKRHATEFEELHNRITEA